jgi:hypothetical protein
VAIGRRVRSLIRTIWFDKRNYKYHFIHIPKNGGVSVRRALEMNGTVSLSKPYHYRYVDVVNSVGKDLIFFAIVRNPWSRTASRFMFGKQNAGSWAIDDPRRMYIENATFEQYVKEQRILPIPEHPGQPWMGPLSSWFNQLEWIRDEKAWVACECLRLETVQEDISKFLGRDVKIPRRNVTAEKYDYKSLYSEELIQIVADLFHEDIDYFGFDFDSGAQRNTFCS